MADQLLYQMGRKKAAQMEQLNKERSGSIMQGKDALVIKDLSKIFHTDQGEVVALDNINLNIKEGEFISIVGSSGCGKSTLLRIISGLEHQTSGTVTGLNGEITGPGEDRGMAFQESRLFPWLTVEKNVLFGLGYNKKKELTKKEQLELAYKYLNLVGLRDFGKVYPNQLSGGMQQRASIARALISNPQTLLLDEPFGALDALTKVNMQQEIQRIWQEEKRTVILVTHDIEEAIYLGDRIIVLSARPGKIQDIIEVNMPRPRFRSSAHFVEIKKKITSRFFTEQNIDDDYNI